MQTLITLLHAFCEEEEQKVLMDVPGREPNIKHGVSLQEVGLVSPWEVTPEGSINVWKLCPVFTLPTCPRQNCLTRAPQFCPLARQRHVSLLCLNVPTKTHVGNWVLILRYQKFSIWKPGFRWVMNVNATIRMGPNLIGLWLYRDRRTTS